MARSSSKQGPLQPHALLFKGQATEQTTVKWSISGKDF